MISAHSPPHELREPGSFSSSSVRINAEQVRDQTGRDATVYSAGTTANLGEDRCSSTPVLPLPSFGSAEQETPSPGAERYWPEKLRRRVIWPPAASWSFYPSLFWTISSLWCGIEPLAVTSSDKERKPYGAPSVLRRGKAGVSSLKGQKPDIALRSSGTLPNGSNNIREAGAIHQITSCCFPPLWCLCNSSNSHFLQVV